MNKHLKYLNYVIRHKWYVFQECCKQSIIWRGIIHDMSKLYPSEWKPYVDYFYGETKNYYGNCNDIDTCFDVAWLKHQNRNKHHWQYWVLMKDNGSIYPLDMPMKYVKEMYADWVGANRATRNKLTVKQWYEKNKNKMMMSDKTKEEIKKLL